MRSKGQFVLTAVSMVAVGCQSYERRPLNLDEHARAYAERAVDVEPIRRFAAAISEPENAVQPFDAADGISLEEAEAVALHFNPTLRFVRAQADVPLAAAKEAGWWPDPQFEAEILRFANRGQPTQFRFDGPSFDGVNTGIFGPGGLSASGLELTPPGYRRIEGDDFIDDPWVVGASLSLTIPLSGRIAAEKDLKWTEYSAAWRQILVQEWQLLTQLREAWLEWSTSQQRADVVREYTERLDGIARVAEQLAKAGEMKATESRVLSIELARRLTSMVALDADAAQKRLSVLALMGVAPGAPIALHPDAHVPPVPGSAPDRLQQLVANHPRINAVRADYEAAEQRLRLEIRKQYPDLQIGPSFSFEEGFSRIGFGFGFPIPLWNRNRQGVAQAFAEREAARTRAEAEVELTISELAQVETRLEYARQQREFLLQRVAPLAERQLEDSRTLLSLGEVDVLLLRDALTSSLDTKLDVLDAALAEARAANTLAQMLQPRWATPSQAEGGDNP